MNETQGLHPPAAGRVGNERKRISGEGCSNTDRAATSPPRRLVPRLRPSRGRVKSIACEYVSKGRRMRSIKPPNLDFSNAGRTPVVPDAGEKWSRDRDLHGCSHRIRFRACRNNQSDEASAWNCRMRHQRIVFWLARSPRLNCLKSWRHVSRRDLALATTDTSTDRDSESVDSDADASEMTAPGMTEDGANFPHCCGAAPVIVRFVNARSSSTAK